MRTWGGVAAALFFVVVGASAGAGAQAPTSPEAVIGDLEGLRSGLDRVAAEGGWPRLPPGPTLETGATGPRVVLLRDRLRSSGDLADQGMDSADPAMFDAPLDAAVRRFQARHGLAVDGIVGAATTAAMNVPVERRIAQIDANIARWRALPADLGERYVLVNAAAFQVELVEDGALAGRYRAIVGRVGRPTPVFSADMTYVALAPFWEVPPGIARNDVLPRIQADPEYLAGQRMRVFDARSGVPVNPAAVDWSAVTRDDVNARYRFRADPGPPNPLGGVKFIFPNPHNAYMHDTPARDLFERPVRTFSSGCVRVESALDLAVRVLRDVPGWSRTRIEETIARGTELRIDLPKPFPVYIQYFTAWVDESGVPQFRDDIYSRDQARRSRTGSSGAVRGVGFARMNIAGSVPSPRAVPPWDLRERAQDIASCPD